ncbi:hypothetical protein CH63R_02282 [Colletotrichum higginsianum IMI 349063]|uniref:Uncharacterized protein n=1 Tax=Colletotrichum higginsianum (strain IMI 349063) TaxID=759273 RepID=A0A1B7YNC7_COLHI|nr:hypothetical protein CH63R_02282 [Colletotrichum higginsianum IMI 349063]OBR13556.1 hypothetical protein CH63R_02282 [Colletotrichum higginsianum IMI 349063]
MLADKYGGRRNSHKKAKEREKHETNASGARAASSSTPYAKTLMVGLLLPARFRREADRFSLFALAINTHPCLHPNLAIVRTISFVFGQLGVPVVIALVVQGRSVDLRGPTATCRPAHHSR